MFFFKNESIKGGIIWKGCLNIVFGIFYKSIVLWYELFELEYVGLGYWEDLWNVIEVFKRKLWIWVWVYIV